MNESNTIRGKSEARSDRVRLTAVSGAILVVAAVVGVDGGLSAASASTLVERGAVAAVRSVSVARASGLESATGLGWTAVAILAILLVRRVSFPTPKVVVASIRPHSVRVASLLARQRRKRSISSQVGGLYGP